MKQTMLIILALVVVSCQPKTTSEADGGPPIGSVEEMLKESPADLGYTNVSNWLKFPPEQHPDWEWDGTVAGVGFDSKGHVYVSHRGEKTPKLTVWNPDGTFLRVFPGPKGNRPHYVKIDWENNDIVWWMDSGDDCIYKMDQDGNILLILGKPGISGDDHRMFSGVTDIGWDSEGFLYVTDGDKENRRVLKYDDKGDFMKRWGSKGQELGQFDYPHAIFVDSKDRVFVCDRNNYRVQVFDKNGNQLDNWTHIGRVYEMVEDKYGNFLFNDGKNGRITKTKPDGTVIGFFEAGEEDGDPGGLINAHSMDIGPNGDLVTGMYHGWVEYWQAPQD